MMNNEMLNTQVSVPRKKINTYNKMKQFFQNAKKTVDVVGGVATVALVLCPLDGPFGEIASLLATGILHGMVSGAERIYDKIADSTKQDANIMENATDIARNIENEKENFLRLKDTLLSAKQDLDMSKGKSK